MEVTKLREILDKHLDWLRGVGGGERANLDGANLDGANLYGANLYGAKFDHSILFRFQIVPESGAFTAYKKAYDTNGAVVLKLEIPPDAARVGGVCGRKCRAEKARVVAVLDLEGKELTTASDLRAGHDPEFRYAVGEFAVPDKWDGDPTRECTNGIHFFITFKEAADY